MKDALSRGDARVGAAAVRNAFRRIPNGSERDVSPRASGGCIGGAQYAAAIVAIRKAFPNGVATDTLSIDYFVQAKQYDEAMKCIDHLDKSLDGDPALDALRGSFLNLQGKTEAAYEAEKKAVSNAPNFRMGYIGLMSVTIQLKRYDEAARLLTPLTQKFGVKIQLFAPLANYTEFIQSPEFQQWKKSKNPHETIEPTTRPDAKL